MRVPVAFRRGTRPTVTAWPGAGGARSGRVPPAVRAAGSCRQPAVFHRCQLPSSARAASVEVWLPFTVPSTECTVQRGPFCTYPTRWLPSYAVAEPSSPGSQRSPSPMSPVIVPAYAAALRRRLGVWQNREVLQGRRRRFRHRREGATPWGVVLFSTPDRRRPPMVAPGRTAPRIAFLARMRGVRPRDVRVVVAGAPVTGQTGRSHSVPPVRGVCFRLFRFGAIGCGSCSEWRV
jgi:hypothetical protein